MSDVDTWVAPEIRVRTEGPFRVQVVLGIGDVRYGWRERRKRDMSPEMAYLGLRDMFAKDDPRFDSMVPQYLDDVYKYETGRNVRTIDIDPLHALRALAEAQSAVLVDASASLGNAKREAQASFEELARIHDILTANTVTATMDGRRRRPKFPRPKSVRVPRSAPTPSQRSYQRRRA